MKIFKTNKFILTTLIFVLMTTLSFGVLQVFRNKDFQTNGVYAFTNEGLDVELDSIATVSVSSNGYWKKTADGVYEASVPYQKKSFIVTWYETKSSTLTIKFNLATESKLTLSLEHTSGSLTTSPSIPVSTSTTIILPAGEQTLTFNCSSTDAPAEGKAKVKILDLTPNKEGLDEHITEGRGTAESPYIIDSYDDFASISNAAGAVYLLKNDITFPSNYTFTPICAGGTFTGTFLGNNKTISGLKITSGNYAGMFAQTSGGTIKDLKLTNINMTNVGTYCGMLIGYANNGTVVQNIEASGVLSSIGNAIGGLVGYANGQSAVKASNIKIYGTVATTGVYAGGLSGAGGTFENCVVYANVSATQIVGGITGGYKTDMETGDKTSGVDFGKYTNCYVAGDVAITGEHTGNYAYWGIINGYGAYCKYTLSNVGQLINFNYTSSKTVEEIMLFNSDTNADGILITPTVTENGYNFTTNINLNRTYAGGALNSTNIMDETTVVGILGNYGGFVIRFNMEDGTYKYVSTLNKEQSKFQSVFEVNLDDLTSYVDNFANIEIDTTKGTKSHSKSGSISVFGSAKITNANDLEHLSWIINGAIPTTFAGGLYYNARSVATISVSLQTDIDLTIERKDANGNVLNRASNGEIINNFYGFGKTEMYPYRGSIYGNNKQLTINMDFPDSYLMGIICVTTDEGVDLVVENLTVNGTISGRYRVGIIGMNDNYARSNRVVFTNVVNNANITAASQVGAFLGEAQGNGVQILGFGTKEPARIILNNCVNNGNITATEGDAGGLIGTLDIREDTYAVATINNCTNNGKVTASRYAGGFIGQIGNTVTVQGTNISAGIVTSETGLANFYVGLFRAGGFSTTTGLQTLYKINLGTPNSVWNITSSAANLVNLAGEVSNQVSYTADSKGFVNVIFANLQAFNGETLTLEVPLMFNNITITPSASNTDNFYTDAQTLELYKRTMATGVLVPVTIEMCSDNVYNALNSSQNWQFKAKVTYSFNISGTDSKEKVIELTAYAGDEELSSLVAGNRLVFNNVVFKHADYNIPENSEFTKNLYRITKAVEDYVATAYNLVSKESGTNEEFKNLGLTAQTSYQAISTDINSYGTENIKHFNDYISNTNENIKNVDVSEAVLFDYLKNIASNIEYSTTQTLDYGTYSFSKTVTFTMLMGDPVVKTINYSFEKSDIDENLQVVVTENVEFKVGEVVTGMFNESVTATINKYIIDLRIDNNENAFYDGTAKTLEVQDFTFVEGDEDTIGYELKYNGLSEAINVGEYVVTVSLVGEDARFYELSSNVQQGRLVINQVKYAIETEHGKEFTYNNTQANVQYNLTQSVNAYKLKENDYSIVYSGETLSGEAYLSSEVPTLAGNYVATLTLHNDNLAFIAGNSFEFSIKPSKLEIIPFETTLSYKAITYTFNVEFTGLLEGDTLNPVVKTYNQSGAEDVARNAGTYSLKIIDLGNTNYYVEKSNIEIVINQEQIQINLIDQTAIYGDAIAVDQTKFEMIKGEVYGEDSLGLKLTSTVNNLSTVGNYDIVGKTTNNNYNVTIQNALYHIIKRDVELLFSEVLEYNYLSQDFYDDIMPKTKNIVDRDLKYFAFELYSGETLVDEFKDAGNYTLKLTENEQSLEVFKNYNINKIKENYTIIPQQITLKPKDVRKNYTQAITSDDFVLQNVVLQGHDSLDDIIDFELIVLSGDEQVDYTALGVGDYTIKLNVINDNLALSGNYVVTILDGVLEIFQKETYIVAEFIDFKVYDEEEIEFKAIMVDEFNNEIESANVTIIIVKEDEEITVIKDAGTYSINVIGDAGASYKIAKATYSITINPNIVKINLSNTQPTYNSNVYAPNYTYTMSKDVDISNILSYKVLSSEKIETTAKDAGEYIVEFNISNENYILQKSLFNVLIKPIDLTLTILPQVFTYGEEIDIQATKYDLTEGLIKDEALDLVFISEDFENVAGTYTITAKNSNKNYNVAIVNSTITINKRELDLTIEGASELTFDKAGYSDLLKAKLESEIEAGVVEIYYLNEDNQQVESIVDAGRYLLVIEIKDTENNEFSEFEETKIVKEIVINKKVLDLNIQIESKTYDGHYIELKGIYANDAVVDADIYNIEYYKETTKTTQPKDVGNYSIKVVAKQPHNYTLNNNVKEFNIGVRELTISEIEKEYSYSRTTIKPAITLFNVVEGEDVVLNVEYVDSVGKFKEVGEYTIKINGLIGSNTYNYNLIAPEAISFNIVKAQVEVSVANTEFVFNNKELEEKDLGVSFASTLAVLPSDYEIVGLPKDANSYALEFKTLNNNIKFSINAIDIIIHKAEVENVKFEDLTIDFDNQAHSIFVSTTTITNGAELAVEYSGTNFVDAGEYTITATLSNPNYITKVLTATLTIRQLVVTLPVSKQTEFVYNTNKQGVEIINLDTIWYSNLISYEYVGTDYSSQELPIDAGSYILNIVSSNENNIKILNVSNPFVIKHKGVAITSTQSQTTVYNAQPQSFILTTLGIIDGTDVFVEILYSEESAIPTSVGNYDITIKGLKGADAKNYVIENQYITPKFSITPYELVVTAEDKTVSYGDSEVELTFVADKQLLGSDEYTGNLEREKGSQASSYIISQGTLSAGENYKISFVSAMYNIVRRELKYSDFAKTFTYNGQSQIPEVEFTNIVSGDINVAKIVVVGDTINAGTYKLNLVVLNPNYVILNDTKFDITINQAEASDKIFALITSEIDYSGNAFVPMVMVDGGHKYTLTYTTNNEEVSEMINAGVYKVKVELKTQNFKGTKTFDFVVNKIDYSEDVIKNVAVEIMSDSFIFSGLSNFEVSVDGNNFVKNKLENLESKTTYQVYIKVLESKNYKTTTFVLGEYTTCPSAENINEKAENIINKGVETGDIDDIKQLLQDYSDLTDSEELIIDEEMLNDLKEKYEEYFNQIEEEVEDVRIVSNIVDFNGNVRIKKLGVSLTSMLCVGALCLKKGKKKDEDNN